jgi:hypothetical protein
MKTIATETVSEQASAVAAPLQIALSFDHPVMAEATRKVIDRLIASSAPDSDMHRDEWSFAELEHTHCRAEALELAAHCDLFVVAITGIEDIPDSFLKWIDDWLASRANMETAVILCVGGSDFGAPDLPRCEAFQHTAGERGLLFLRTTIPLPKENWQLKWSPHSVLARLHLNKDELPEESALND